jgi:DNA polymerase III alpha subunit (gram-positive type)
VPSGTSTVRLLVGPGKNNTLGMRPGKVLVGNKFGSTMLDKPYSVTSMTKGKAPGQAKKITKNQLKKFNKKMKALKVAKLDGAPKEKRKALKKEIKKELKSLGFEKEEIKKIIKTNIQKDKKKKLAIKKKKDKKKKKKKAKAKDKKDKKKAKAKDKKDKKKAKAKDKKNKKKAKKCITKLKRFKNSGVVIAAKIGTLERDIQNMADESVSTEQNEKVRSKVPCNSYDCEEVESYVGEFKCCARCRLKYYRCRKCQKQ